jgi:D-glycero-alpha-D-manno-heptose 1-phosphate guanylyltransferase
MHGAGGWQAFSFYVIEYCLSQKVERFILSLGYKHEVIEEYVSTAYPHIDVAFSVEEKPLGTGGAIKLACSKAKEKDGSGIEWRYLIQSGCQ